jgi:hypothetical protein
MKHDRVPTLAIKDFLLEEWIRCPYKYYQKNIMGIRVEHLNWRQMAQYGVNHVINDYYTLPNRDKTELSILKFIERRWTNKIHIFYSNLHFREVRSQVTGNLIYALLEDRHANSFPPLILFESFKVYVEEIDAYLSMIFQVVKGSNTSYVIKKYIIDEDPDVINLFKHLAVIFCNKAFAKLPETIEIHLLLSGENLVFTPSESEVAAALDYLSLIKQLIDEAVYFTKKGSITECKTCPFQSSCQQAVTRTNKIYQ